MKPILFILALELICGCWRNHFEGFGIGVTQVKLSGVFSFQSPADPLTYGQFGNAKVLIFIRIRLLQFNNDEFLKQIKFALNMPLSRISV